MPAARCKFSFFIKKYGYSLCRKYFKDFTLSKIILQFRIRYNINEKLSTLTSSSTIVCVYVAPSTAVYPSCRPISLTASYIYIYTVAALELALQFWSCSHLFSRSRLRAAIRFSLLSLVNDVTRWWRWRRRVVSRSASRACV